MSTDYLSLSTFGDTSLALFAAPVETDMMHSRIMGHLATKSTDSHMSTHSACAWSRWSRAKSHLSAAEHHHPAYFEKFTFVVASLFAEGHPLKTPLLFNP